MSIFVYSKSGDVIGPILKPQWWVKCKPLAEEAIKVQQDSSPVDAVSNTRSSEAGQETSRSHLRSQKLIGIDG
jgi:valyl-tRNA synthetase